MSRTCAHDELQWVSEKLVREYRVVSYIVFQCEMDATRMGERTPYAGWDVDGRGIKTLNEDGIGIRDICSR